MSGEWVMKEFDNEARDLLATNAATVDSHYTIAQMCIDPVTTGINGAWDGDTSERTEFLETMNDVRTRLSNLNNEVANAILAIRNSEPLTVWKYVWEDN